MAEARDVIARAVAIARGDDPQYAPSQARLTREDRDTAELGVRRVLAAGYRILGPDEVDPVTVEKAADAAYEVITDGEHAEEVATAVRALGRKV